MTTLDELKIRRGPFGIESLFRFYSHLGIFEPKNFWTLTAKTIIVWFLRTRFIGPLELDFNKRNLVLDYQNFLRFKKQPILIDELNLLKFKFHNIDISNHFIIENEKLTFFMNPINVTKYYFEEQYEQFLKNIQALGTYYPLNAVFEMSPLERKTFYELVQKDNSKKSQNSFHSIFNSNQF